MHLTINNIDRRQSRCKFAETWKQISADQAYVVCTILPLPYKAAGTPSKVDTCFYYLMDNTRHAQAL